MVQTIIAGVLVVVLGGLATALIDSRAEIAVLRSELAAESERSRKADDEMERKFEARAEAINNRLELKVNRVEINEAIQAFLQRRAELVALYERRMATIEADLRHLEERARELEVLIERRTRTQSTP
jgi:hypothetical protein